VRLDSGQRAWRYAFLRRGAADSMLVVWAVASSRGVATVACLGTRAAAAPAGCEAIARSLRWRGPAALDPDPSAAFWGRLPAVVTDLQAARASGRAALAAAAHARAQATAAAALATAHRNAAAALDPLARGTGAPARAVDSLRSVAAAYDALAAAARARVPAGYAEARARVIAAERVLVAALARARGHALQR
jgi:hypothetical protein